jgi:hypothetical protein
MDVCLVGGPLEADSEVERKVKPQSATSMRPVFQGAENCLPTR